MAITGRLSEMSLPTLVQLACQEGRQARLSLTHDAQQAALFFDGGNVVHAILDDESGEEVIYRLLEWEEGEFRLDSGVESPARTIDRPWSALLVDGLQRRDEEHWETLDFETIQKEYEMAENMNDILKEMGGQVSGYMASAVVGMDGLNVAQHATAKVDPESISGQMTVLLKLVDTTTAKLGAGAVEDYLLTTDRAYFLIRFLGDKNYYLGMAADRKAANLGNMRLNARLYCDRLTKAMPR